MRISPLNFRTNMSKPVFKSTNRQVYFDKTTERIHDNLTSYNCKNSELLYSNYTQFFRADLSKRNDNYHWEDFIKLLSQEFKDAKKVNVYDFASSDGSEAYSLIIGLIEQLGDEAQKFFPIKAYDIDKSMVRCARSGIVHCDSDDMMALNKNTSDKLEKYFTVNEPDYYEEGYYFPFELKRTKLFDNLVEFKVGEFVDKLSEIKGKNALILCRNFWPYLSYGHRKEAFEKMSEVLKPSSLVVVGHYDDKTDICEWFYNYGFEKIDDYVYKKLPSKKLK